MYRSEALLISLRNGDADGLWVGDERMAAIIDFSLESGWLGPWDIFIFLFQTFLKIKKGKRKKGRIKSK
jgi:hypothetical protein